MQFGAKSSDVGAFCPDDAAFNSNLAAFSSKVGAKSSNLAAFNSNVGAFNSNFEAFNSNLAAFCSNLAAFCSSIGAFCRKSRNFMPFGRKKAGLEQPKIRAKAAKHIFARQFSRVDANLVEAISKIVSKSRQRRFEFSRAFQRTENCENRLPVAAATIDRYAANVQLSLTRQAILRYLLRALKRTAKFIESLRDNFEIASNNFRVFSPVLAGKIVFCAKPLTWLLAVRRENEVKSVKVMFLVIGTRFFTWGGDKTPDMIRCSQCGTVTQFTEKTGMRFLTLFFIVPTIPLSGRKKMIECPNCKARFQTD